MVVLGACFAADALLSAWTHDWSWILVDLTALLALAIEAHGKRRDSLRALLLPFTDAYRDQHDPLHEAEFADSSKISLLVPMSAVRDCWDALGLTPGDIAP